MNKSAETIACRDLLLSLTVYHTALDGSETKIQFMPVAGSSITVTHLPKSNKLILVEDPWTRNKEKMEYALDKISQFLDNCDYFTSKSRIEIEAYTEYEVRVPGIFYNYKRPVYSESFKFELLFASNEKNYIQLGAYRKRKYIFSRKKKMVIYLPYDVTTHEKGLK